MLKILQPDEARSFSTFDIIIISSAILYSFQPRYEKGEDAKKALEGMNGHVLAGRKVITLFFGLLIILLTFVAPLLAVCPNRPPLRIRWMKRVMTSLKWGNY